MSKEDKYNSTNEIDYVNHPPHYEREGAIECIDEIEGKAKSDLTEDKA